MVDDPLPIGRKCRLTNSGTLRIDPGAQVDIAGTIDNTGTIWVDTLAPGGGGGMRLTTEGDATLTGGGTIDLGDNVNNRIYSTVTTRLLTNVDNTIRGGGDIGNGDMSIINQGVVEASGTTDVMRLWAQSSGTFTNEGVLHAMTAPGMEIWGPFTTSGQVTVDAGSTLAREGTYQQTGGVTAVNGTMSVVCCGGAVDALELDGGSLTGTGTITAIVSNTGGSVEPGNSAGILSITGPYTQGAAGSMTIELGGTIAGIGHDQLAVTGDVSLDGTLEVVLVGSYQPGPADEFTIVTSGGSLDGTFAEVSPGSGFTVTYLADAVVLGGFQPCLADCGSPSSGAVDVTDLLALLAQWGGPGACDIDESGAINVTDLLALLAQWGACP